MRKTVQPLQTTEEMVGSLIQRLYTYHPRSPYLQVEECVVFSPEGFWDSRLLTADLVQEVFLRDIFSEYAISSIVRFRHLANTQRNAEIIQRHASGETLAALAKHFRGSEQRVWL